MLHRKGSFWFKWATLFLIVALIVPVLFACGKEKEKTPTPTPPPTATSGPTPTATPGPTPTPTPAKGPVKIGVIMPWSGPLGMGGLLTDQIIAVVEEQLKNQGGILGGREVQFVRGDDRGVVAESAGQAKKLIVDDKVAILTCGGVSSPSFTAVADVAEELKVPYVAFATIYGLRLGKYSYSACLFGSETVHNRIASFLIDVVKPKTVAWLAHDLEDSHSMLYGVEGVVGVKERLKDKGIETVYEQFFPLDTMDFSPYLTKIKYVNPDILVSWLNSAGQAITINKQIMELGGWGSIRYFSSLETGTNKTAINLPSAVGTYAAVMWLPGSDDPGMKAFEDAFVQRHGWLPTPELTFFYNCLWTAIKAIELAGTDDPDKVAEALRSGNLEWDSAWGHLRISPDGIGVPTTMVAQIQEGGELVKVWFQ